MNKFKNDPDYGDYLYEQEKDRQIDAAIERQAQKKLDQQVKDFWNKDICMTDSNHSRDTVVFYKGQFIGSYPSLRSANAKAEELYDKIWNQAKGVA